MKPRARTKVVAFLILSFLALVIAVLGAVLAHSGWGDRQFLLHGERKTLEACLQNPALDCDPRHWPVLAGAGGLLLVVGVLLLVRIGARLRRLLR